MNEKTSLWFLRSGRAFYDALFDDLKRASSSIRIEMYIIERGEVAGNLTRILIEKAREGIAVSVVCDAIGSLDIDETMPKNIRDAGGRFIFYNPISPYLLSGIFPLGRLFRRSHRKLIVIDEKIFYVGGMNIGDRFLDWEDIMVRGVGAPADELVRSFDEIIAHPRPSMLPRVKRSSKTEMGRQKEVEICDCRPRRQNYPAKRLYLAAIKRAHKRVWIAQAYFLPRRKLKKALVKAATRGVDVRIMIPDRSDIKAVDLASWPPVGWLVKKGIKVYRYTGGMFHTKMAIIDDNFLTVGGVNLDSMSMYWNLELNLIIRIDEKVKEVVALYEDYLKKSRQVEKGEAAARPFLQKILSRIFYAYSWIL